MLNEALNIIALVPARSGSKGVKDKNKRLIHNIPLISYTLRQAKQSKYIHDIYVSSDDDDILEIAKKEGVLGLERPLAYAQDTSSAADVVTHFLGQITFKEADILVYLQPTSPLRTAFHIDQAIQLFKSKNPEGLVSVVESEKSMVSAFMLEASGYMKPLFDPKWSQLRRQEMPKTVYPNGAIYIFNIKSFLKENKFPYQNLLPFIMNKFESLDIDTEEDLLSFQNFITRGIFPV
jgi:CMP-N-acetylneuraminic acid synthetase